MYRSWLALALFAPSLAFAGPYNVIWNGGECAYAEPENGVHVDLNRNGTGVFLRTWDWGSVANDGFTWTYDETTFEFVAVMDFGYTYVGTYDPATECVVGVGDLTNLYNPYYSWPTEFYFCQGSIPSGMSC